MYEMPMIKYNIGVDAGGKTLYAMVKPTGLKHMQDVSL